MVIGFPTGRHETLAEPRQMPTKIRNFGQRPAPNEHLPIAVATDKSALKVLGNYALAPC